MTELLTNSIAKDWKPKKKTKKKQALKVADAIENRRCTIWYWNYDIVLRCFKTLILSRGYIFQREKRYSQAGLICQLVGEYHPLLLTSIGLKRGKKTLRGLSLLSFQIILIFPINSSYMDSWNTKLKKIYPYLWDFLSHDFPHLQFFLSKCCFAMWDSRSIQRSWHWYSLCFVIMCFFNDVSFIHVYLHWSHLCIKIPSVVQKLRPFYWRDGFFLLVELHRGRVCTCSLRSRLVFQQSWHIWLCWKIARTNDLV